MILLFLLMVSGVSPVERLLVDEITSYDQKLAELELQQEKLTAEVSSLEEQILIRKRDRDAAEVSLHSYRSDAGRRLAKLYRMRRRGLATVLLAADSPLDFRRRFQYLVAVVQADRTQTQKYLESLEQQRLVNEKLAGELTKLSESRAELDETRGELSEQRTGRLRLLREIRSSEQLTMTWERQAEDARQSYQLPVTEIDDTPDGDFRSKKGKLRSPIKAPILRGYGALTDSGNGELRQNLGVDFVTTVGTPFIAVAGGVVSQVRYVRAYGQTIVVEHGAYSTLYAHANGVKVAQGDTVKAGQTIGMAGNTGLTDDSKGYLHFEVRYNGTAQNPEDWLATVNCHPQAENCGR